MIIKLDTTTTTKYELIKMRDFIDDLLYEQFTVTTHTKPVYSTHPLQIKILELAEKEDIGRLTLREIGTKIGMTNNRPQQVKHHLQQLIKKGLLDRGGLNGPSTDFHSRRSKGQSR